MTHTRSMRERLYNISYVHNTFDRTNVVRYRARKPNAFYITYYILCKFFFSYPASAPWVHDEIARQGQKNCAHNDIIGHIIINFGKLITLPRYCCCSDFNAGVLQLHAAEMSKNKHLLLLRRRFIIDIQTYTYYCKYHLYTEREFS